MSNALEEIQSKDRKLVNELLEGGSPEILRQLFRSRLSRWDHYIISGDFHTSTLFSDLENQISKTQAFDLIPVATQLLLEQENENHFETALGLLKSFARLSDTTEMPKTLDKNWENIRQRVEQKQIGKDGKLFWNQLANWYRRNT